MNQILYTDLKKNKNKGPTDIRKVVKVFCIILIVFGIVLVGQGSYAIYKNSAGGSLFNTTSIPQAEINKVDDQVEIVVSHNKAIDQLSYHWDEENEKTIDGNGRTNFTEKIDLPTGTHTLNVTIRDVKGEEAKYNKEFVLDKPSIEFTMAENNIVKVKATDDKELAFLTYRWNDEEEQRIEPTGEDKKVIETDIKVSKPGINTLTVTAVDTSNNMGEKSQKFEGVTSTGKPTLTVVQEGSDLLIKAEDETELKEVSVKVNDDEKLLRTEQPQKIIEYRFPITNLVQGDNKIIVTAYNSAGETASWDGVARVQ